MQLYKYINGYISFFNFLWWVLVSDLMSSLVSSTIWCLSAFFFRWWYNTNKATQRWSLVINNNNIELTPSLYKLSDTNSVLIFHRFFVTLKTDFNCVIYLYILRWMFLSEELFFNTVSLCFKFFLDNLWQVLSNLDFQEIFIFANIIFPIMFWKAEKLVPVDVRQSFEIDCAWRMKNHTTYNHCKNYC